MLSRSEAEAELERNLGQSPRARHSRCVALILEALARNLGEDADLWAVTGLLHDIDFEQTGTSPERHGLLAAEWLAGRLPDQALDAIRAHDHRTGVTADTSLAAALKLADALAVILESIGADAPDLMTAPDQLAHRLAARPWLADLLYGSARRLGIHNHVLRDIASASDYVRSN